MSETVVSGICASFLPPLVYQQTPRHFPGVQWLRLCISSAGVWVQSLVGKLRSCIPCGATKKKKKKKKGSNNWKHWWVPTLCLCVNLCQEHVASCYGALLWISRLQKNIYFCFIDYTKAFDCMDHNNPRKILKEMEIPDHLTCLLRNLYAGQEATELDMEQQTGSKSGKEYVKAVYCHPAYLTYMQSTSCELLRWMKHKLESGLLGKIPITSDA